MKRFTLVFLALLVSLSSTTAYAQTPSADLGTCLTDNTTGKDRKALARWFFTALAAHPEMETLSAVEQTDREDAARQAAMLFTRLLTEDCVDEAKKAIDSGGRTAIKSGFEILGQVAMQELLFNERVQQSISSLDQYVDQKKFEKIRESK